MPVAASAITSLTIEWNAALPDGADAANPNGWVAKAVLPDDGASVFDPTRIVLTVEDPGFASDGSAAVRTRTVRGGAVLRRQYPNQAQRLNSASAGSREVWFSLSDDIFAGSTIAAAEAEAGYHGDDAAGSIAGVVNSSSLAYPKPLFAWLNIQHERAGGTHFAVEAVAYHQFGRLGQMVACVEYEATEGANSSGVVRASAPALSDFQTKGQRVEAWKGSIPLASLSQAALCQVNAVVKPWIGTSWSLAANEVAWPTANPQTRLRFLNDKAGTYGGAIAYVRAGAGGTPQVSLVDATARANPYATLNAAIAALPAFNNTNRGHNDHSGATIHLMDDGAGGAVAHALAAGTASVAAGLCWTDIRPDPSATGAVSLAISTTQNTARLLRHFENISHSGGNGLDGGSSADSRELAIEGGTVSFSGSPGAPINYRFGLSYFRNVTFSNILGNTSSPFRGFSTTRTQAALALGCVATDGPGTPTGNYFFAMIGCDLRRFGFSDHTIAACDAQDGAVLANNRLLDLRAPFQLATNAGYASRGVAMVQNVFERAVAASSPAVQIGADEVAQALDNVLDVHNTVPGADTTGRANRAYTSNDASVGVQKRIVSRFNLWCEYNCKADSFTSVSTLSGRTGAWRNRYTVGHAGNVVIRGSSEGGNPSTPDASGGNWLGEYWQPGSKPGAAAVSFVDDRSGTAGAGGGDYALSGASNDAYDRVPEGQAMLRYDLAGNARRGDGTGAAGVYEQTS